MPSANELLRDAAIARHIDITLYSNGLVRKVLALLNGSDSELMIRLAQAIESYGVGSFSAQRLDSVMNAVRLLNQDVYQQVARALLGDVQAFTELEIDFQKGLLTKVPASALPVSSVPVDQVYAAVQAKPFQGRLLSEWAADIEKSRMTRIRDAVRIGFVAGETIPEIVRKIRGSKVNGYADGILEIDRRSAESVVRTAIAHTASVARDAMVKANSDLVKAVQWVSTLDTRTTETCFPASTVALPVGELRGVIGRHWEGQMVTITTASGKKLRATPNHPVLTARGWRAINELCPGQDVLYRVGSDVVNAVSTEDVGMPPTIGALFDSVNHPSVSNVFAKSTSEADFHGDGMIGEHIVNYPSPNGDLRLALNTAFGEKASEYLFGFIAAPGRLPSNGDRDSLFVGNGFNNESSQSNPMPFEDGVQAGFADPRTSADAGRTNSVDELLDELCFVMSSIGVTPPEGLHDSGPFKGSCHCGCADSEASGKGSCGLAISVSQDQIILVEREFFSGHVYNLSTSSGFYIADGFIVHNCMVRDGLQYSAEDHSPIGHKVPWLGGPGQAHWGCRSVSCMVLKSNKELGIEMPEISLDKGRASMDGMVAEGTTYADWFAKQSAARQDEIVGPTRGRLYREGKVSFNSFTNNKGQWLTLAQLAERA